MKYKVLSNLKTGGRTYTAGEMIEMDADEAEVLVEDGVLEATEPKEEVPETPEETETEEDEESEKETGEDTEKDTGEGETEETEEK